MPFGGLLSLVGAGSAIGSLFGGGGAGGVPMPQGYQFQNQGGADTNAYNTTGGLSQYNIPGQVLPQYQNIAQSSINNPYASLFQSGANQTGAAGYGAGQQQLGTSLGTLPDVNALLSLGFDPQNALYSRSLQQVTDQTRAGEAARGIQTTPYGAGVESNALNNFNIDWQNNALGRATQGAGAAGGLLNNATGGIGAGLNNMTTGSGLPYNTFQGINANALGTLGQFGQFGQSAAQIPQQQIGDYLQYLSGGTNQQNANTSLFQQGLNQNNMAFNQNQTLGGNLGSSLAGFSKGWGSPQNPFAAAFGG